MSKKAGGKRGRKKRRKNRVQKGGFPAKFADAVEGLVEVKLEGAIEGIESRVKELRLGLIKTIAENQKLREEADVAAEQNLT